MDVKNRAKAEKMKANLKHGSGSTFDCTGCGLKASFQASEEESLNLWESRIGEEK